MTRRTLSGVGLALAGLFLGVGLFGAPASASAAAIIGPAVAINSSCAQWGSNANITGITAGDTIIQRVGTGYNASLDTFRYKSLAQANQFNVDLLEYGDSGYTDLVATHPIQTQLTLATSKAFTAVPTYTESYYAVRIVSHNASALNGCTGTWSGWGTVTWNGTGINSGNVTTALPLAIDGTSGAGTVGCNPAAAGCGEEPVLGCTDEEATNYDPEATEDDGSCEYAGGGGPVYGGNDSSARGVFGIASTTSTLSDSFLNVGSLVALVVGIVLGGLIALIGLGYFTRKLSGNFFGGGWQGFDDVADRRERHKGMRRLYGKEAEQFNKEHGL